VEDVSETRLNRVNYDVDPNTIPDTDEGNLRLYYELELLRSAYESEGLEKQLHRYITIIDILGKRGLYWDFSSELAIDKATRRDDWGIIMKPVPKPRAGEKQDAFISRCISAVSHADPGRKKDQIIAMCFDTWRRTKKSGLEKKGEKSEIHIHIHLDEENS